MLCAGEYTRDHMSLRINNVNTNNAHTIIRGKSALTRKGLRGTSPSTESEFHLGTTAISPMPKIHSQNLHYRERN